MREAREEAEYSKATCSKILKWVANQQNQAKPVFVDALKPPKVTIENRGDDVEDNNNINESTKIYKIKPDPKWEIERKNLQLHYCDHLGSGNFGQVIRGSLTNINHNKLEQF